MGAFSRHYQELLRGRKVKGKEDRGAMDTIEESTKSRSAGSPEELEIEKMKEDKPKMTRGEFVYKCRNCKKKFIPVSYPDALGSAVKAVKNNELHSIHSCKNGDLGVADLIVVKRTESFN